MGVVVRGMRNVLRNPLRLFLVILLLGASLMFVAAMFSLSSSAQEQLDTVRKDVGTGITINLVSNNSGASDSNTNGNSNTNTGGNGGRNNGSGNNGSSNNGSNSNNGGGGNFRFGQNNDPVPNATITKVKTVSGVTSVSANLRRFDTGGTLKAGTVTTPDGSTRTRPVIVNGISNGDTHFTLTGGTPTIVSGRSFQDSDANANVAMMSKTLASANNLQVGSTFTLQSTKITIIGLYTTEQTTDSSITLPMASMQRIYNVAGVDSITAYAASYDQVESVATNLRKALGSTYDVVTQDSQFANSISGIDVAQRSIQLALVIAIVVAAIVIVFSVFIIVRERTSEIGTLKAIGASAGQVIAQFWVEVLALSILASAIAIVFLAALGPIISQWFDVASATATTGSGRNGNFGGGRGGGGAFFQQVSGTTRARFGDIHLAAATLNLQTLLIILGVGVALAVLTSGIPAWYVSRIKPAEVLRKIAL